MPIRSLLLGVLLVLPSPGASVNRLELIEAQPPQRNEGNRDRHLRIDAPRDGAVVFAGETLRVSVSSPDRTRFVGVVVVIEDLDDVEMETTSLPAHFTVKIPKSIASGVYGLNAMGGRANGELVVVTIDVDIERRDMPRAIAPRLPKVYLEKKGETREIGLVGEFGIGDFVDVVKSSRVTFESSNTAVATVDAEGTVTAVGSGRAAVVAWYGPRDRGVNVSIPVEVR
jgi:hypothetical protein